APAPAQKPRPDDHPEARPARGAPTHAGTLVPGTGPEPGLASVMDGGNGCTLTWRTRPICGQHENGPGRSGARFGAVVRRRSGPKEAVDVRAEASLTTFARRLPGR